MANYIIPQKLTKAQEETIIKDTIIDWLDQDGKNDLIEFIVNQLNKQQRKDILQLLENEYKFKMLDAMNIIGLLKWDEE